MGRPYTPAIVPAGEGARYLPAAIPRSPRR